MKKRKKNKQPKYSYDPKTSKTPKSRNSPDNIAKNQFKWRVDWIDLEGPWGWNNISHDQLFREVIVKLHHLESMTWHEIFIEAKKQHHSISIAELHKDVRTRIQDIERDDWTELHTISIKGKCRVWGIRNEQQFKVLWWDPEHKVCPSKKKHT